MTRTINRRQFNAGVVAVASAGFCATLARPSWSDYFDHLDQVRTAYDPTDLGDDPLIARPMPVRITRRGAELHMVAGAPAEVRVLVNTGGSSTTSDYIVGGVEALSVPLQFNGEKKLRWSVRWRARGDRKWRHTVGASLSALPEPGEPAKIILVGDTHTNIEGLVEGHRNGAYEYGMSDDYLGELFRLISKQAPDLVVFCGDDVGIDGRYMWIQKEFEFLPHYELARRNFMLWRLWRQIVCDGLEGIPAVQVNGNHDGGSGFDRRDLEWATAAKKLFFPQPLPSTSILGGEDRHETAEESVTGLLGFGSPRENYYGLRVGAVDLLVLDIMGYSGLDKGESPRSPKDWSYGRAQRKWLHKALKQKNSWKLLVTHHLAGGSSYGPHGEKDWIAYGRGGAYYAGVGEQALIHKMMLKAVEEGMGVIHTGAHDHNWWHALVDSDFEVYPSLPAYRKGGGVIYTGAGSPSHIPTWADLDFHWEMYRGEDFAAKGFIVFEIEKKTLNARYVKCAKPGISIDGTPVSEIRAPATMVGNTMDSFKIGK